jgi:iron complex outermembrane receptor protein
MVARGTFQLTPDHQAFIEGLYAKNEYRFVLQPVPIGTGVLFPAAGPGAPGFLLPPTSPFYPHDFAALFGLDGQPLDVQWRAFDAGLRDSTTTAEQTRIVAGFKGVVKGWDYEAAYSYNLSKDKDHLNGGYLSQAALLPIINSGNVNPFGPNTPEIVSQLAGTAIKADARSSKSTVNAIDGKVSNEIYNLPAGPLAVAFGGEWRKEKYDSVSSDILSSGDIVGYGTSSPTVTGDRKVYAFFAEAIVPIVKGLELDAAVRYDNYSDFGSTTNPKLSLRWQPTKQFLARASYGTGFRAPALPELFSPLVTTNTQPGLSDPVRCPITNDQVNDCVTQFVNVQGGNTQLKPEESTQYSVGAVWEPLEGLSLGVDWYSIKLKDQVGLLNPAVVLGDVTQYAAFITRGPADPNFPTLPGPITAITTLFTNLGETRIEGIDVDLRYRTPQTAAGRFRFGLQGTYYTKYDIQQIDGSFAGQIGLYSGIGGAINRWKHYATIDWDYGAWGATLAQTFGLGYTDANPDVNGNPRRVGNYDVYDLQVRWTGVKNLTISAGIKNLFDPRAAVHQPGLHVPERLRPVVRRSARGILVRERRLQVPLIERRAGSASEKRSLPPAVARRRPELRPVELHARAFLVEPEAAARDLEALLDDVGEHAGAPHARSPFRAVVLAAAQVLNEAHDVRGAVGVVRRQPVAEQRRDLERQP